MAFESVNGAHWVRASKSDVPSVLFDFHVVPPHLPHWAFTAAHMWGRLLAWWAALTNYEWFSRIAISESKKLVETIDPSFCSSELPMHSVVPFAKRGGGVCFARASSNTKGVLVHDARGLAKAHETLKELCSEEHHQEVKDALELAGHTRALCKGCYDLLFSKPGERIGWGVDHNAVEWSLHGGSVAVQREVRGDLLAAAAAAREESNDGTEMMTREESNDPGSENINERSGDDSDPGIVALLYSLTPLFPCSHISLLPYFLTPLFPCSQNPMVTVATNPTEAVETVNPTCAKMGWSREILKPCANDFWRGWKKPKRKWLVQTLIPVKRNFATTTGRLEMMTTEGIL